MDFSTITRGATLALLLNLAMPVQAEGSSRLPNWIPKWISCFELSKKQKVGIVAGIFLATIGYKCLYNLAEKLAEKQVIQGFIPRKKLADRAGSIPQGLIEGLDANTPHPPKAIILHGQKGSGKTHLIECIAGEKGIPVISMPPYSIDVAFNTANSWSNKYKTKVIVLVDGLEQGITNDETARILAERIHTSSNSVIFVGIAHDMQKINEELTRKARIFKQIKMPLPSENDRAALFEYFMSKYPRFAPANKANISQAIIKETQAFTPEAIQECVERLATESRSNYHPNLGNCKDMANLLAISHPDLVLKCELENIVREKSFKLMQKKSQDIYA